MLVINQPQEPQKMIPTDEIIYTETALVSYARQSDYAQKAVLVLSVQCSLNRQRSMYTSMLFKLQNAEKLSNKGISLVRGNSVLLKYWMHLFLCRMIRSQHAGCQFISVILQ